MNELVVTAIGVMGRSSILADEVWANPDFAVIGVVVAVMAFLAACLWRAARARDNRNPPNS